MFTIMMILTILYHRQYCLCLYKGDRHKLDMSSNTFSNSTSNILNFLHKQVKSMCFHNSRSPLKPEIQDGNAWPYYDQTYIQTLVYISQGNRETTFTLSEKKDSFNKVSKVPSMEYIIYQTLRKGFQASKQYESLFLQLRD